MEKLISWSLLLRWENDRALQTSTEQWNVISRPNIPGYIFLNATRGIIPPYPHGRKLSMQVGNDKRSCLASTPKLLNINWTREPWEIHRISFGDCLALIASYFSRSFYDILRGRLDGQIKIFPLYQRLTTSICVGLIHYFNHHFVSIRSRFPSFTLQDFHPSQENYCICEIIPSQSVPMPCERRFRFMAEALRPAVS